MNQLLLHWHVIEAQKNACTLNVSHVVIALHHITPMRWIPQYGGGRGKLVMTKKQKNKDGQLVKFKVTKKKVHGTIQELVSKVTSACRVFRKHVFNIRHQYSIQCELRKRIEATWTECVLHIDFSENYNCGYSNEIQTVHFGGSHTQATMHTGVMYVHNEVISFCTVSDSHRHDPPAIWTYNSPVFEHIR